MEQTEAYIDRVGSFDPEDIEDKSFGEIKDIIKNEVDTHKKHFKSPISLRLCVSCAKNSSLHGGQTRYNSSPRGRRNSC